MQDKIIKQIKSKFFSVEKLEVKNTSENHIGHAGYNKDSHFEIVFVSDDFIDKNPVVRHRMVIDSIKDLMNVIHSVSLRLFTKKEYENQQPSRH